MNLRKLGISEPIVVAVRINSRSVHWIFVNLIITVVIDAVTKLRSTRINILVRVVTVAFSFRKPVPILIDRHNIGVRILAVRAWCAGEQQR